MNEPNGEDSQTLEPIDPTQLMAEVRSASKRNRRRSIKRQAVIAFAVELAGLLLLTLNAIETIRLTQIGSIAVLFMVFTSSISGLLNTVTLSILERRGARDEVDPRVTELESRLRAKEQQERREREASITAYASDRIELSSRKEVGLRDSAEKRWSRLILAAAACVGLGFGAQTSFAVLFALDQEDGARPSQLAHQARLQTGQSDATPDGEEAVASNDVGRERDWRLLLAGTALSAVFFAGAGILSRLAHGQARQREASAQRVQSLERLSFAVDFAGRVSDSAGADLLRALSSRLVEEAWQSTETETHLTVAEQDQAAESLVSQLASELGTRADPLKDALKGLSA